MVNYENSFETPALKPAAEQNSGLAKEIPGLYSNYTNIQQLNFQPSNSASLLSDGSIDFGQASSPYGTPSFENSLAAQASPTPAALDATGAGSSFQNTMSEFSQLLAPYEQTQALQNGDTTGPNATGTSSPGDGGSPPVSDPIIANPIGSNQGDGINSPVTLPLEPVTTPIEPITPPIAGGGGGDGSLDRQMTSLDQSILKDFGASSDGGQQAFDAAMSLQQTMLGDPNLSANTALDQSLLSTDQQLVTGLGGSQGGEQLLTNVLQSQQQMLSSLEAAENGGGTTGGGGTGTSGGDGGGSGAGGANGYYQLGAASGGDVANIPTISENGNIGGGTYSGSMFTAPPESTNLTTTGNTNVDALIALQQIGSEGNALDVNSEMQSGGDAAIQQLETASGDKNFVNDFVNAVNQDVLPVGNAGIVGASSRWNTGQPLGYAWQGGEDGLMYLSDSLATVQQQNPGLTGNALIQAVVANDAGQFAQSVEEQALSADVTPSTTTVYH